MSEENIPKDEAEKIPASPRLEASGQIEIETKGVFDQSLLDSAGCPVVPPEDLMAFLDNPMPALLKILTQSLDAIKPRSFEPAKSEHKVRIFCLDGAADIQIIEREIEAYLNDGYCCHLPAVCNDFLIMDFSRRKETEENEREQ